MMDDFAGALLKFCGGSKDAVFSWLAGASQTKFAQLAFGHRICWKKVAKRKYFKKAGIEVGKMANALDPSGTIPIALCGGLAEVVWSYLQNPCYIVSPNRKVIPPKVPPHFGQKPIVGNRSSTHLS